MVPFPFNFSTKKFIFLVINNIKSEIDILQRKFKISVLLVEEKRTKHHSFFYFFFPRQKESDSQKNIII